MKRISFIIFVLLIGCSTSQYKTDFGQSSDEIEKIIKDGNGITPEQKVILRHAADRLRSADSLQSENAGLRDDIADASKDAGAGKMAYAILAVIGLAITAFITSKIFKIFF